MSKRIFPQEIRDFIFANYKGISTRELTEKVNSRFGTSYLVSQLDSFKGNNKLNSGLNGQFKKGLIPHNKGKKGCCPAGSEKGWFKKGRVSENHKPVGSERIDSKDGYVLVKVAEGLRMWRHKHRVIWEQHHGPVPKNHIVIFLDGDMYNFDINNLACVSQSESLILNRKGLRYEDTKLTETGILIAKVIEAGNKKKREKIKKP